MSKILLLNLPGTSSYSGEVSNFSFIEILKYSHLQKSDYQTIPLENLRMMYMASHLEALKIPYSIIDACIEELTFQEVYEKIKQLHPSIICMPHSRYIIPANQYYSDIKFFLSNFKIDWECHITLEGFFPSQQSLSILKNNSKVNSIIQGNGEIILPLLFESLVKDTKLDDVPDLIWQENDEVFINSNLKITEAYTFENYPNRKYVDLLLKKGFTTVVRTGYGCQYLCKYCLFSSFFHNKFHIKKNRRSTHDVCNEIQELVDKYKVSRIAFADEIFFNGSNEDRKWILDFCDKLSKKNFAITFSIDLRLENCNEEILNLLKKVGLSHVFLGIENITYSVLKRYGRSNTLNSLIPVIKILDKLNIDLLPGMILFDKKTLLDDLKKNIELMKKLDYYSLYRYTGKLHVFAEAKISEEYQETNDSPIINWKFENHETKKVYEEYTWFFGKAIGIYKSIYIYYNSNIPNHIIGKCIKIHQNFVLKTIDNFSKKVNFSKQLALRNKTSKSLEQIKF